MATAELQSSLGGFITHWSKAEASERANAQPFLIGLAKILGVPEPSNSHADGIYICLQGICFRVRRTGNGQNGDGRRGVRKFGGSEGCKEDEVRC